LGSLSQETELNSAEADIIKGKASIIK